MIPLLKNIPLAFCAGAICIILSGCARNKGAEKLPPPEWMGQRPLSNSHYVGIGSAAQTAVSGDALANAKKRAAADLASEIAVKVESASLLESAENNGTVSQRFTSSISSHAEERIAGFEVVDIWENEERVHVFYRLNKARHAQAREARRNAAMESALAEYALGMEARAAGQVHQALNHFGTGVMALEEFWNEVNRTDIEGQLVTLEPHLLRTMRNTVLAIKLDGTVEAVDLNATNNFKYPLGIGATIDGHPAAGVPLKYQYHNGTYLKRATEFTDDAGAVVALISGVAADRPDPTLTVELDTDRLWKAANLDAVLVDLVGSVTTVSVRIPIGVSLPTLSVEMSGESTVPAAEQDGVLTALRNAMRQEGFTVLSTGEAADFNVEVDLRQDHRTPSEAYTQFHTVYINGAIRLRSSEGQLTEEIVLDRSKGVQLNPQSALKVALSKTADSIEKTAGKKIATALQ